MGIQVLGPLQVHEDGSTLAPRERVVLEALVLRLGEVVSRDQLAEALWGRQPPATWAKALQTTIVRLRKALGATAIDTVDHGYRLAVAPSEVDAREFEQLVGRGRELIGRGEPDRAAYVLNQALGLWRGAALADLDGWEPGRQEADRLTELRADAEEMQVDAALRSGRHGDVLSQARRLVEQGPLRERRWELLALAQYRCGQQADALRTLHQLRRMLVSELGIDPGPDASALEQAILRQDPRLQPQVAPPEPHHSCPYLGLVPYDVADSDAYFGRDGDVEVCRRRLVQTGVLVVVGPSGSGKSSLVRAGLAAALLADGERVVVVTPGRRPMAALSTVPTTGRPVLLVVDQAEEAVTMCDDPAEVEEFFAVLTSHAPRGRLVVALRADSFGALAAYADFARLVEQSLYVLTPMTADSLREAIEGPARLAGLRLEPGLAELLVADVEGQSGALPHLSHALRQTWERREGGVLTIEGYRATGGIRDAVARTAEQVHEELLADERTLLRDVMLRLVSAGPAGEPVRSRIPRRLLTIDARHDQVLERLVAARLVTSDEGVVELAHEALAWSWPRLQGWLDEDTEGQRILRHLAVAADTWEAMGRPEDELYRGTRLVQALEWRERSAQDITSVEADFLAAGERRAEQEQQSALAQATYQARVNRRLRGLLVGAALLLVAALVTGTLAVRQANRAADATDAAVARRVAAQAQLAGSVDQALLLAAAALGVETSAEARAGLLAALARIPQLAGVRPLGGHWLEISPDGHTIVSLDADHRVWFRDATTLEVVGDYDPYPDREVLGIKGNVSPMSFSGDGALLAVGLLDGNEGVVRVLDPETHDPVTSQPGGQPVGAIPTDVKLSADGRFLAVSAYLDAPSAGVSQHVYVWDLTRAERPLRRIEMPSDTFHIAFSGDGRRLYAAPGTNSDFAGRGLWIYDVRTGRQGGRRPDGGQALVLSPDDRTLAYGLGSDVVLSEALTGAVRHQLRGAQGAVVRVAFSADGRLVAAVSDEPAAHVWETRSGRHLESVPLEAEALDVSFDGDGTRLFVPSGDRLLALDLTGEERYVRRTATADPVDLPKGFRFRQASPYAPAVAVSTYDLKRGENRLRVEDRTTGRTTARLGQAFLHPQYDAHAWSPTRRHLVFSKVPGQLRVVEWRTGHEVAHRSFDVRRLNYTRDGRRILAAGPDGVALLDARTLRNVHPPVRLPSRLVAHAAVGPGEDTAVVVTAEDAGPVDWTTAADRWLVLDLRTGHTLQEGRLLSPAWSMAVSPDRTRMASASPRGMEIVDLRSGRSTVSADIGATAEAEGVLVAFSPDGALLASADGEGRVSLRDGSTAALLGTVHLGDEPAPPVFLDDQTLLLAYPDGSTFVWDTSAAHALDSACRILGGDDIEWRVRSGDRAYDLPCA
ncbi:MAG TPA: BTAD domain-containing putative transcriptional regulator [Marmoricola sp.]|nr:BTAD domain-containing putative transcriptional regulator [Marmoricola sp.]